MENTEKKGVVANSKEIVLNVAKVTNRGIYKYAVLVGNVQLQRFKTEEEAKTAREKSRSYFEYLAGSASVMSANSKKTYVFL